MKHFFTFFFVFFTIWVCAQNGTNKIFSFLEMSNSSRLTALGGNMASVRDGDISLALSNPSLISDTFHSHLAINYTEYFSDINNAYVTYSHTFDKFGSFAASLQYMDYGKFRETDESGNVLGEFSANDLAATVGWGRKLHPNFSLGANVKFLYSNLRKVFASGAAVDVAASYFNDEKQIATTLAIRNFGTQIISYSGIYETLPFDIQLGFSKKFLHVPLRFYVLAHHLHNWNISYFNPEEIKYDPLTGAAVEERKIGVIADEFMRHFVVGAEFLPFKNFMLRVGYNYQRRKELAVSTRLSTVGFSWGFGFRIKYFYFSYARSAYHLAGSPNVITLTTNINSFLKPKKH